MLRIVMLCPWWVTGLVHLCKQQSLHSWAKLCSCVSNPSNAKLRKTGQRERGWVPPGQGRTPAMEGSWCQKHSQLPLSISAGSSAAEMRQGLVPVLFYAMPRYEGHSYYLPDTLGSCRMELAGVAFRPGQAMFGDTAERGSWQTAVGAISYSQAAVCPFPSWLPWKCVWE